MPTRLEGIGFTARVVHTNQRETPPALPTRPEDVALTQGQQEILDVLGPWGVPNVEVLDAKFRLQNLNAQQSLDPEQARANIDFRVNVALQHLNREVPVNPNELAMIGNMDPKDRARYLIQKQIAEKAEALSFVGAVTSFKLGNE